MFATVEDPFTQQLLADYDAMFPDTKYRFSAGSTSTGMYRGIKLYEQAIIATNGDVSLEAASAALDSAAIAEGPGGPARMVPGTGHVEMNMYIAQAKGGVWDILSSEKNAAPQECG